jgi:hypothetical protein
VPTSADVLAILDRIARRIARRLADEARDDSREEGVDVLAQVQAEAAATWRSPHGGKPTVRGVERLRAWWEGFSLRAGVVIADHDREALERLCRYGTRPAFAHERLAWTADGQIAYRLKRPWPDGRTELVLPPVAFLRRLCGIIPPLRRHLVRYAGVFGPASKARAQLRALVPARGGEPPPAAATPSAARRVPAGSRGPSCCAGCSSDVSTTARTGQVTAPVRITHPFHPQRGQEIEVVVRRRHWGDDRVFYRSAHGHLASLPARWTSLVPDDPVVTVAGEPARFRLQDLIELAAIVSMRGTDGGTDA